MLHVLMGISLFCALIPHEIAHAWAARRMGCELAAMDGRISLDPRRHLDLFGSLLLPLFLALSGSPFLVGYAKPVRVNPENFRSRRLGMFTVALAGPAANLLLAALVHPFADIRALGEEPGAAAFVFLFYLYNLLLAAFNLIPLPPLDGSNMLRAALPAPLSALYVILEPLLFAALFALLFTGGFSEITRPWIEYLTLRM